jgi:DnaK suppressor protein
MKPCTKSITEVGIPSRRRVILPGKREMETPPGRLMKQRQRLLRTREDLLKEIRRLTADASEETPSYSMHPADAATDSFDRDLVPGIASFGQEGLYEIDAALKRLDEGTYGTCELTGCRIPWERLEAVPWTRFTVEAEKQMEVDTHPRIGSIGRIQPPESDRSEEQENPAETEPG